MSVITYSNVVSVYQVSSRDVIAAQVFPGTSLLTPADKSMLKENFVHFCSALEYCQDNVSSILKVFSKNRVETKSKTRSATPQLSCLGAAIQVATSLVEAHGAAVGHSQHHTQNNLLFFLSRAPNVGPGAIERGPNVTVPFFFLFFLPSALAPIFSSSKPEMTKAVEQFYREKSSAIYALGARADLFCIGNQQVGVTQLKHLVNFPRSLPFLQMWILTFPPPSPPFQTRPCGGYLFVYKYAAIELESDLLSCLTRRNWPLLFLTVNPNKTCL